jgi:hypothetical protein
VNYTEQNVLTDLPKLCSLDFCFRVTESVVMSTRGRNRLRRGKFRGRRRRVFRLESPFCLSFFNFKRSCEKIVPTFMQEEKRTYLRVAEKFSIFVGRSSGMHGASKDAKIVLENRRGTESENIYENVISPAQLYHNKTTILKVQYISYLNMPNICLLREIQRRYRMTSEGCCSRCIRLVYLIYRPKLS